MTPKIVPISDLTPSQPGWMIKARVTKKQELYHYNKAGAKGKVFNFDLVDSNNGEIRAICFNEVADRFYTKIEVGNIYKISGGSLILTKKNYNHINHDYEMHLRINSKVELCHKDDDAIPRNQFRFQSINDVRGMKENDVVDIIGVVFSVSPAASVTTKKDTKVLKRSVRLKDMSGLWVELSLWGTFFNNEGEMLQALCDSDQCPILAVNSCRVSDFGGKELGTIPSTRLFINPDFSEADILRKWFESGRMNTSSISIARGESSLSEIDSYIYISQIEDENVNYSARSRYLLDLIWKTLASRHSASNVATNTSTSQSVSRTFDECYKCHLFGHWAKDCPLIFQLKRRRLNAKASGEF